MYVRGYLQGSENGRVVTIDENGDGKCYKFYNTRPNKVTYLILRPLYTLYVQQKIDHKKYCIKEISAESELFHFV
jgi:hypothetical protein